MQPIRTTWTAAALAGLVLMGAPGLAPAQVDSRHCEPEMADDIERVSNQIQARWLTLEGLLEDRLDIDIGRCLRRKFQGSDGVGGKRGTGQIICAERAPPPLALHHTTVCAGGGLMGFSYVGTGDILFCFKFLERMRIFAAFRDQPGNRRACVAALMVHEFFHDCGRSILDESRYSDVRIAERVTFRFWRDEVKAGNPDAVTLAGTGECFSAGEPQTVP